MCAYPELAEKREYIKKIISVEEEAFAKTADKGSELPMDLLIKFQVTAEKRYFQVRIHSNFQIQYGFLIDLTIEICEEKRHKC